MKIEEVPFICTPDNFALIGGDQSLKRVAHLHHMFKD